MLNSPINGNSLVRIGNKPIFAQNLLKASIEKFIDIYNVVRNKFYTYQDLRENYQLENVSFLQYCLLIAAVPRYMKVIINQDKLDAELDLETNLDTWDYPDFESSSKTLKTHILANYRKKFST